MAAPPLPLSLPPPPTPPPPPGGAGAAGRAAQPGAARPRGAGQGGSGSGGAVGLRERRRSPPSSPRRSALRPGRTDSPLTPSHPLRPGRRRRRRRGAARQRKEQVSAAQRPGRGRTGREREGRERKKGGGREEAREPLGRRPAGAFRVLVCGLFVWLLLSLPSVGPFSRSNREGVSALSGCRLPGVYALTALPSSPLQHRAPYGAVCSPSPFASPLHCIPAPEPPLPPSSLLVVDREGGTASLWGSLCCCLSAAQLVS